MFDRISSYLRAYARNGKPGAIARLVTDIDYTAHAGLMESSRNKFPARDEDANILAEIEQNGIIVIENFWSEEECSQARNEIDRLIDKYPQYVNKNAKADHRVYGANHASTVIDRFGSDPRLLGIAQAYNCAATMNAFTLAARMPASANNKGSGEGWHRDAFLRQFKAIMYLTEVTDKNGPFQLITNSQKKEWILQDMKSGKLGYMQYRIPEEKIGHILADKASRLRTLTAAAGTLLLVDTSMLHRGMPIQTGTRYALTNYYFPTDSVDQSMYEKFDVLPKA